MRFMGIHTTGPAVKNHISPKSARELIAIYPTMYHLRFLAFQRVLPLLRLPPALHSSSSSDSVFDVYRYAENPVPERSGRMSEELRGDPQIEILTRPSAEETQTNAQQRETWCKNASGNSSNCQKTRNYANYVLMRV